MKRTLAIGLLLGMTVLAAVSYAATATEISRDARAALQQLYATEPVARSLGSKAKAVLVFPSILKAGFLVGAQGGDGALIKGGKVVGYYRTLAASYGFQAGVEKFGYALFFMDDEALAYLDKSDGWELGSGPSLVVADQGFKKTFSTTTLQKGVYAFAFDQKGLMGGIGVQGSKITRIHPDK